MTLSNAAASAAGSPGGTSSPFTSCVMISGTAPTGVGTDAMRGVTNFFNKGSAQGGTVTATSTLGIRGLGAQDLARSQPNLGAVDQADALRLDGDQARQFASSAALSTRQVDALPEPAPAQSNNPTQSNIN